MPEMVIALLVMTVANDAPVWLTKLNRSGITRAATVVTVNSANTVPTLRVAVLAVVN